MAKAVPVNHWKPILSELLKDKNLARNNFIFLKRPLPVKSLNIFLFSSENETSETFPFILKFWSVLKIPQ